MKSPRLFKKNHKNSRRLLSLLLCCVLAVSCLALPASSSDLQADLDAPGASAPESGSETTGPDDDSADPEASPEPGPDDSADPEASPEPGPDEGLVTVTFQLSDSETVTIQIESGHTLTEDEVPDGESMDFGFPHIIGWENLDGYTVDPMAGPITQPVTFVARWGRTVEDLFDLSDHKAYIKGYSNGMFKPSGKVTRAEAATLFYNLLKVQPLRESNYTDVAEKDWFYRQVSAVSSLGLMNGYTGGGFAPKKYITRAEFIKVAVSCDVMEEGLRNPFPDVKSTSWAAPYIANAYQKGWISGGNDGNFRPGDTITRAEAVTILNRMLGRAPDADIKNKAHITNFYDVYTSNWAYGQIAEASTSHTYEVDASGKETWTSYTKDTAVVKPHWVKEDGKTYYVNASGKFVTGEQTINGKAYLFGSDGATFTGFHKKGQWTRYYKDGVMLEDIANLGVTKGPYYIKVYKPANYVIIFAKDAEGKYTIPVRSMLASCGNPTPTGTFYSPGKYRWLEMVGGSWAQWCTQIQGSYLFHSVPNDLRNNYTMWAGEYNNLGTTRSLGCIRLTCEDAKWMYDNCALGTQIYISPTETSGPLPKPKGIKLPGWHTWDPTDPTAVYLCRQHGCH